MARDSVVTKSIPALLNSSTRSAFASPSSDFSSARIIPVSPLEGIFRPAAISALLIASARVFPKHATSPVERISTPTVGSAPSICMNENCGAFTANCLGSGTSLIPSSFPPRITVRRELDQVRARRLGDERAATCEARRLHSITSTSSLTQRNWMLNGPFTPSSFAMARV